METARSALYHNNADKKDQELKDHDPALTD